MIRVEYTNGKGIAQNSSGSGATDWSNNGVEVFNATSTATYLSLDGKGLDLSGTKRFLKFMGISEMNTPLYNCYRGLASSTMAQTGSLALGNNFYVIFQGDWSAVKTLNGGEGLTLFFDKNPVTHCLVEFATTPSGTRNSHYEYNGTATNKIYIKASQFTTTTTAPYMRISQITLADSACAGGVKARAYLANVAVGNVENGEFDDIQSHDILEEVNILSTDLPCHSFEAVVANDVRPVADGKIAVYSDDKYINTYWIDSVEQVGKKIVIDEDHGGWIVHTELGEDLYRIVAYNAISLLDRAVFRGWRSTMYIKLEGTQNNYTDYSGATVGVRFADFINSCKSLLGVDIYMPNYSQYGIRGYVDHKSYRHNLCAIAYALGKMVISRDGLNVYLVDIPHTEAEIVKTYIEDDDTVSPPIEGNILGQATLQEKPTVTAIDYKTYVDATAEEVEIGASSQDEKGLLLRLARTGQNNWKRQDYPLGSMLIYFASGDTNGNADCYADYMRYWTKRNGDAMQRIPINLTPTTHTLQLATASEENIETYDQFTCTGLSNIQTETEYRTSSYNMLLYLSQYKSAFKGTMIDRANDFARISKSKGVITARVVLDNERAGDLVRIKTFWGETYTGIITRMNIHCGYPNDVADIEIQEIELDG